jgi:autotransporter-associated beta strand protein/T5SS/PEP-CTERM-associated repeat protein
MRFQQFAVRLGRAAVLSAAMLLTTTDAAWGTFVYDWIDSSGGDFNDVNNWSPNGKPPLWGLAYFYLPNTYTVTFPVDPLYAYVNEQLQITSGNVTFASSGATTQTYTLSQYYAEGWAEADVLGGTLTLGTSGHPLNLVADNYIYVQTGGTLNVNYGSHASAARLNIGTQSGSTGTVLVDGSGSQLNATNFSYLNSIGYNGGTGNLTYQNSASGTIQGTLYLAKDISSSTGNLTVQSNANLALSNSLYVGGSNTAAGGTGTLNVSDNGQLSVGGTLKLWNQGTLNLSGGAVTTHSFDNSAGGTINFTGGALIVDGGDFAWGPSSQNSLDIEGSGWPCLVLYNATPSISYFSVSLGYSENKGGYLDIYNGTHLITTYMNVGGKGWGYVLNQDGNNEISYSLNLGVNTAGSYGIYGLIESGYLSARFENIGLEGTGIFDQEGGTNNVDETLYLGKLPGSSGTYNLHGGTLIVRQIIQGSGTAIFNFGGGTMQATNTFTTSVPITLTGAGGDATIDTQNYDVTISSPVSGDGGLNKLGAGTLILSANATYLGDTTIEDGLLQLNGANSVLHEITGVGNLGVGDGATPSILTANYIQVGTLTVAAGSEIIIAPLPGGPLAAQPNLTAVPEPCTLTLLLLAGMGLWWFGRRKSRQ